MSKLRASLIWLVKAFLGYATLATPTFAILYWAQRITLKQLLPPYLLLFCATVLGILLMFDARRHVDQQNSFRIRVSLSLFMILFSYTAVVCYFGNKYGLIKPEYSMVVIVTGLIGAVGVSLHMFFYSQRWLRLRNPLK